MVHPRIRKLRRMLGVTQYELAKRSGVGRTRLCLFERGHVALSASEQAAIEKALISVSEKRISALRGAFAKTPVGTEPARLSG
jgi:predicted transcriptional regulator